MADRHATMEPCQPDPDTRATHARLRERLLRERDGAGHWTGTLSSSALSTATAIVALQTGRGGEPNGHPDGTDRDDTGRVLEGVRWLLHNQNADGGWGDTVRSPSNLSTTTLCRAALQVAGGADAAAAIDAATRWIVAHGGLTPDALAQAIQARYGRDRTFAVPILTLCAICAPADAADDAWRRVMPLPFELAAFPQKFFRWLRLPVVSYALPALIAIGLARHVRRPSRNPLVRALRRAVTPRVLRVLERIQPPHGGFLEATPLTSFVAMSLVAAGQGAHPVAARARVFLRTAQQPDGAWPIDTNLATWCTTLAINALAAGPGGAAEAAAGARPWLLEQQFRTRHPYTDAAPGGWAWTDLPGGVPDADDTAGALLALRALEPRDAAVRSAAAAGIRWLLGLQNADGGIPTFCRGWGRLPFDRSSPDITIHAVRALDAWLPELDAPARAASEAGLSRAESFLLRAAGPAGTWTPLWFGNDRAPDDENLLYGTARVVCGIASLSADRQARLGDAARRGAEWLLSTQAPDGGWGGAAGLAATVEETALATSALAAAAAAPWAAGLACGPAARAGARWLCGRWTEPEPPAPAPIGFYFARLWYFERLYPLLFSVEALGRVESLPQSRPS